MAPRPWYLKKRYVIPLLLSLALAAGFVHTMRAALTVDAADVDPGRPEDGVHTQLVTRAGRAVVRASARTAAPPERVWAVVTGYERFGEVFPLLSDVKVTREPDGRVLLSGEARTPVGRVPFATRVKHEEGDVRRASWDEPSGRLTVNRGHWAVSAAPGGSKLEYEIDLEVSPFPAVAVRAALLKLVPGVVEAVLAAAGSAR
jgi:ribosome-associated toxin RatA of RatAB toxin-antitoxin module